MCEVLCDIEMRGVTLVPGYSPIAAASPGLDMGGLGGEIWATQTAPSGPTTGMPFTREHKETLLTNETLWSHWRRRRICMSMYDEAQVMIEARASPTSVNQGYHHEMHRSGKHVLSLQRWANWLCSYMKLNMRQGLHLTAFAIVQMVTTLTHGEVRKAWSRQSKEDNDMQLLTWGSLVDSAPSGCSLWRFIAGLCLRWKHMYVSWEIHGMYWIKARSQKYIKQYKGNMPPSKLKTPSWKLMKWPREG